MTESDREEQKMKVVKFGGSSMADAGQYRKVRDILLADPERRVVVVSAAGKRFGNDHKLTDLLYLCYAHVQYGVDCSSIFDMIASRYLDIRDELSYKNSGKAVNYWWGMSSGVIDVRVTENCPDSMAELVDILKRGISSGLIMPFHRKITAQSGGAINDGTRWLSPDELLHMDWLCSCVEGSIPGFYELLPMAQSLVRLLGVYRDWIIPDKGEVQV